MSRHENYPDDIRSYDNVPGSPFYQDPNEWMHEKADEMATAWLEELGTTGMIEHEDWSLADLVVLMAEAGKGQTGMNSLQAVKSTVSYLERITLYALLGLASRTDDDDGKGAVVEIATISNQQLKSLTTKIAKVGAETKKLLELFKVETLADLKVDQYKPVHALLAAKAAVDKKAEATK